jgi:NAD(P)-dependent dehydrogenase (short-subunit alcohol dehydrogenase family)
MTDHHAAIVTGAGSGIGRATSILLARSGYHLTLVSRSRDKLEETADLAAQTAASGVSCFVAPTDLCDVTATRTLAQQTFERFGRLDAIANVAGDATLMAIEKVTADAWRYCIDVNLSAVVHLTASAWPIFRAQGGGVIVNVSSMASIDPFPGLAIYATAKAGLNMFTQCTAREGQDIGVKAVAIAPGAVETPMLRGLFDESELPPSQTLDPDQVGQVIMDCITGDRAFEPGETITMPSPA